MEPTNNTEFSIPWEEIKEPLGYSSTLYDSKKCLCGGIAHRTNHQFTKKHQVFLVTTKRYSWKLVNFNGTLYYHSDICPNTLYIGIKTDVFNCSYDGIPSYVDILLESKTLHESSYSNEWDINNIKKYFCSGGISDPMTTGITIDKQLVPLSPFALSAVVDRDISQNISGENDTLHNKLYLYPYQGNYYYTQQCGDKIYWYDQEQRHIYDPREDIPPLYKEDFPPLL